jgi:hypothetical protein
MVALIVGAPAALLVAAWVAHLQNRNGMDAPARWSRMVGVHRRAAVFAWLYPKAVAGSLAQRHPCPLPRRGPCLVRGQNRGSRILDAAVQSIDMNATNPGDAPPNHYNRCAARPHGTSIRQARIVDWSHRHWSCALWLVNFRRLARWLVRLLIALPLLVVALLIILAHSPVTGRSCYGSCARP